MGTKEQLFFEGAQGIGLPVNTTKDITQNSFRPQENAILQPQGTAGKTSDSSQLLYPQAQGCTFCGYCFEGCVEPRHAPRNLKAKRSTDNSYAPMALTADAWAPGGKAVTLLPDSYVDEILYEQRGSSTVATGVRWHDTNTGEAHTETAQVVVMAGGCTEDPRLWLNSGLPDPNGWVGRGYTDHFFDWVIGVFDEYTGSSKGVGSSARCDFPGHGGLENVGLPPALQAFSMAFSDSGVQGYYDNGRGFSGSWDGKTGRVPGDEMKEIIADVNKLLNVLVITDDDVEAQNRVVRSSLPGDEQGPIPKVIFKQRQRTARTVANREYCADQAARLMRAAGARKVIRMDWPPLILHVQSTMRMGSDPADSVLDANAEARFVERLFISSNSALANGLGGPNPTLTTQALATRTAEKIIGKYFDGEPWVGVEAPTSSIDDKVTQAVIDRGF
jgi:choline dehydrogenase-like flavoprotein